MKTPSLARRKNRSVAKPGRRPRTLRVGRGGSAIGRIDLLMELLEIPGPSGSEGAVSAFAQRILRNAGVTAHQIHQDCAHRRSPLTGDVGNLVVKLPGTCRGPRRLLVAHLDTVPICVGCKPIRRGRFIRSADRQTGLGADNRAGCAVVLNTIVTLLQQSLQHPPLTVLLTVQEEVGLQGARLLNLSLLGKPRFGFNWDGGAATKLTIGATGGYRMQIDVHGKASHAGGAPQQGISAIAAASLAIGHLQRTGWHGAISQEGRLGTCNIGIVRGGSATNVVADRVTIFAEARSHDAEFRQLIVKQIKNAFVASAREVTNEQGQSARVDFHGRLDYDSFCLPTDHETVCFAQDAIEATGRDSTLAVANGGLDANWLTARGIPTVTLGCGQLKQHTVDEALDVDEYQTACRIALELATRI